MPRHYSTAAAPVQWAQRPNFPVFSAGFLPIIPMRKFFSACCPKKGNPPAILRKIPGTGRGSPPDGKKRLPDATASGSPGGGWWIRTTEGVASRFTVCPLWPLGKSPMYEIGAGGRIRTPDLLITNQLLYQLSYTSISPANRIIADVPHIVNKKVYQKGEIHRFKGIPRLRRQAKPRKRGRIP